jgi:hypothetical protein
MSCRLSNTVARTRRSATPCWAVESSDHADSAQIIADRICDNPSLICVICGYGDYTLERLTTVHENRLAGDDTFAGTRVIAVLTK